MEATSHIYNNDIYNNIDILGGILLHVKGSGFDVNVFKIHIRDVICEIQECNSTDCKCILPAMVSTIYGCKDRLCSVV